MDKERLKRKRYPDTELFPLSVLGALAELTLAVQFNHKDLIKSYWEYFHKEENLIYFDRIDRRELGRRLKRLKRKYPERLKGYITYF